MNVRRTAAALVVVPLFALASCSGDPHKPPPYTPSPTPTASTSPTPTGPVAPTLPAAAKKHTRAGAEAYVRYYVDVLNYAQVADDLEAMATVTSRECVECQTVLRSLQENHKTGAKTEGGKWTVIAFSNAHPHSGGEYSFVTTINQTPEIVTAPNGHTEHYTGGKVSYTFDTAWSEVRGWRITWLYYNG